jgi:Zn-dependent peptidase ImmA (M78 family)
MEEKINQNDIELQTEELQELYDFWTTNMRLNDVDISVELLQNGDFVLKSGDPRAEGENDIDANRGVSEIIIKSDSDLNREYILVHELSHIIVRKYAMMWDEWSNFFPPVNMSVIFQQFENINESVVNHITKALLDVRDVAYQEGYDKALEELELNNEATED